MLLMLDFLVSGSRNTLYTVSHSVVSDSLRPHGLYPWDSPGQNTGVGSLSLLQGIFPTQGSNPGVRHCRWILYQLSHQGRPLGTHGVMESQFPSLVSMLFLFLHV